MSLFRKGDRVHVSAAKGGLIAKAAKAAKKSFLVGRVITDRDSCCGCYVVEFRKKIGGDGYGWSGGKIGHLAEVEDRFMSRQATKPRAAFKVGDVVQVTIRYDAAERGMVGKIVTIDMNKRAHPYGIQFPGWKSGHSLESTIDKPEGQWLPATHLAKVEATSLPKTKPVPQVLDVVSRFRDNEKETRVYFGTTKDVTLPDGYVIHASSSGWVGVLVKIGGRVAVTGRWGDHILIAWADDPLITNIEERSF